MSKNERKKAGLHKEISSIFKGVVIPQKEGGKESSIASIPEHTDYAEPKQPATESQKNEVPKPFQAAQSLPKAEPSQESKAEPAHTPKFVTTQESKVVPIQQSEVEKVQESKVEKVQESKVEKIQESKAEPAHTPKFVTAQESKVAPVQQSEAEPAQRPKNEPAHKSKFKTTKEPKVIPVQRSKKADIDNISKKVSKKRSAVKVGSESSWKQITNKLFASKGGVSSTKQKATVLMMPVLFIVLLIIMFKGGVFGTSARKTEAGEENNASSVAVASLNDKIDWELPVPYSTKLRDPMSLAPVVINQTGTQTEPTVKLIVKSILYSEDKSSAVIGNRILHEGDQIQNVNIIKINRDNVEFEMNGNKWAQKVQR